MDPQEGKMLMAFETEPQNRIGVIQSAVIRAGKYFVTTELEVENFSRDRQLLIGRDFYYKLGIKIFNLPFSWSSKAPPKKKKSIFQESKSTQLSAVDENGIAQA
jgi:hypothetical protein